MKRLLMYRLPVLLCLLVLSGCARERDGRSLAETAAQTDATALPVLAPVPTFTPVPPPADQAGAGDPLLVSATPAPSPGEAAPCPATGPSPSLRCDKELLLAVRDRLRGEHRELLRNWHPDHAVQDFEGVTVSPDLAAPRVVGLQWIGWWTDPQVRLVGSIPPELGRLAHLEVLDLAGNRLTGSIPEELGQLGQLRELYLNANRLTGPLPAALGQLAQLQSLRLNHNQLTGPIPAELGQATRLRELRLGQNRLTGPIPPWLGRLTALQELYLHANEVTGPIPPELGQLAALRALYLHGNEVTGPIPAELEQRAARHVLFLHLHADEVTENQQGWLEPCPAVGPSPNLRCDKEVLLAVRDRLRGEHRDLLRTWHRDNHIVDFQGVVVSIGDGWAEVVGLELIGWWSDPKFRLVGSLPPS